MVTVAAIAAQVTVDVSPTGVIPEGATVTLTASPKGGSHWNGWDPIATEHNEGCPETGPGSPPTCSVTLPTEWDKGIGYDISAVPDFALNSP